MIKKNESIWHFLSPGLGGFKLPKRQVWYEVFPGVMAHPAVTLGKSRRTLFGRIEYLILYRYGCKGSKDTTCVFEWARAKELLDRRDYDFLSRKNERRKQKEN